MMKPTEVPNYVGDMNIAFHQALQQFNPRYAPALYKEHKEAYFENLLNIIRSETGQDSLSWPEAIFEMTADRICHAATFTLGLTN